MKTQPYIPPAPAPSDSIDISDEFIIRSPLLEKETRLMAPAALLLMTQYVVANNTFEAWSADHRFEVSFNDRLLTSPTIIRTAIAAMAPILGATMNSLYKLVMDDLMTMKKESQEAQTPETT